MHGHIFFQQHLKLKIMLTKSIKISTMKTYAILLTIKIFSTIYFSYIVIEFICNSVLRVETVFKTDHCKYKIILKYCYTFTAFIEASNCKIQQNKSVSIGFIGFSFEFRAMQIYVGILIYSTVYQTIQVDFAPYLLLKYTGRFKLKFFSLKKIRAVFGS